MPVTTPLNLSDSDIERTGKILTRFLRDYEKSIPAEYILPRLDRSVLDYLMHGPFSNERIGIERLFKEISERVLPNSTAIAPFAEAIN